MVQQLFNSANSCGSHILNSEPYPRPLLVNDLDLRVLLVDQVGPLKSVVPQDRKERADILFEEGDGVNMIKRRRFLVSEGKDKFMVFPPRNKVQRNQFKIITQLIPTPHDTQAEGAAGRWWAGNHAAETGRTDDAAGSQVFGFMSVSFSCFRVSSLSVRF